MRAVLRHGLTAQAIFAIGHAGGFHRIANQNHAIVTKHRERKAHHGGVNMHAIGDDLGSRACLERRRNHARLAVMQPRHGVVQMRHMLGAAAEGLGRLIVIRARMGNGNAHGIVHFIDEFERAGLLGSNIDKLDFAARRILQATKHCRIALLHVGGVLCAHLFGTDERTFHIDTHQRGSIGGVNMLGGAFHNARELFLGERHGRAAPCSYATTGLVARDGVDRLMRAVAEIMPHRAMRMHVDQARNGEQPLGIDDLAHLVAGRNDAVAFDEDIVFDEFAIPKNFRTSNFQHAALPFVIDRKPCLNLIVTS